MYITQDQLAEMGVADVVTAEFRPRMDRGHTVEAVTTGVDNRRIIFARGLEVQAQMSDAVFNTQL